MVLCYGNLILQVLKNVVKLGILLFINCCIYNLKCILGYFNLAKAYKLAAISQFLFLVGCFKFK